MKLSKLFRNVVLPVTALAAGIKLGIEYAKGHYVAKDRKFIEGKIITKGDK